MPKNIFVLGLTDFHRAELQTIRNPSERYEFHDLIGYDALVDVEKIRFGELLDRGRAELAAFEGSVDAIVAQWDFPTSVLVPVLAAEHGVPAPSLESVVRCEHKYWSRLEQAEVVPDHVPEFSAFDPFSDDVRDEIGLDFPFWVKPVKSHSSQLGFCIESDDDMNAAIEEIRGEIGLVGDAFDEVLEMLDLPSEIRDAPGTTCLAESIMRGVQAAPEGSMCRGQFDVHGVFDVRFDERNESMLTLDYPAGTVPASVQEEMVEVSEKVLRRAGFDDGCFNVEFLWNDETDELCIVEVNTRLSQSHSDPFAKVDGRTNHAIAIDIALGREPALPDEKGPYDVAAKCFILHGEDGIVTRVPSEDELAELAERFPGTLVDLDVDAGDRLADLPHQDPYNFRLGAVYVGASDRSELEARRLECLEHLRFDFAPVPATVPGKAPA